MDGEGGFLWYQGYLEYCGRTTEKEYLHDFFRRNRTEIGLEKATSVISAAAGNGTFDSRLIRESMPMLKSYTGFDIHRQSFQALQINLGNVNTLKRTNLLLCPLEEFVWGSEPVDVVLMIHMLYYFDDRLDTIAKGISWLRPGGKLMIVVDEFGTRLYSHLSDKPSFDKTQIEECLKQLGFRYEEYKIDNTFRGAGCTTRIADFILQRKATDLEAAQILQTVDKLTDAVTGRMHHTSYVYVVEKGKDDTDKCSA